MAREKLEVTIYPDCSKSDCVNCDAGKCLAAVELKDCTIFLPKESL